MCATPWLMRRQRPVGRWECRPPLGRQGTDTRWQRSTIHTWRQTTTTTCLQPSHKNNTATLTQRWRSKHTKNKESGYSIQSSIDSRTMARNPVFALLWLVILFFLAWPIAAACAGVRYLSRHLLSVCLQIGCTALRMSAGADQSPAGATVPTCFSPFSVKYFVHFRCSGVFLIQAWLILQVSQPVTITYMTKY